MCWFYTHNTEYNKSFILNIDETIEEIPNESQIDSRLFWLIQGFYSISI